MTETPETRAKLANAIRTLQARGESVDALVSAYKAKYKPDINPESQRILDTRNPIQEFGTQMVGTAVDATNEAGKKIVDNANKYAPVAGDTFGTRAKKLALNTAHDVGAISGGVVKTLAAPITTALSTGTKAIADTVSESSAVQDFATSPLVSAGADNATAIKGKIDEWVQANPEKSALIGDAANLAMFLSLGLAKSTNVKDINPIQSTKDVAGIIGQDLKTAKSTVGSVLFGVRGKASGVVGKLTPDASNIMQRVARVSKGKQAGFEKTAGESVGEYLDKRKIYGNIDQISTKLYDRFTKSKAEADAGLAQLKGRYKSPQVTTALDDLYARELKVSSPGAPSPDLATIKELMKANKSGGLDMSQINEAKRIYERTVKLDYIKQNLPESVARAQNIDTAIREWQLSKAKELGFKNLDAINRETRLARQLLNDIGKEYAGSAGNNAVSLTDWIMLSGGDPTAISGFLIKKGFSSKAVQSAVAKFISRNKQGLGDVKAIMNTTPTQPPTQGIGQIPSPNPTTLSPEVQRILNMRR